MPAAGLAWRALFSVRITSPQLGAVVGGCFGPVLGSNQGRALVKSGCCRLYRDHLGPCFGALGSPKPWRLVGVTPSPERPNQIADLTLTLKTKHGAATQVRPAEDAATVTNATTRNTQKVFGGGPKRAALGDIGNSHGQKQVGHLQFAGVPSGGLSVEA